MGPDEQNVSQPLTGMGAGGGSLIVPTKDSLVALAPSGLPAVPVNQLVPTIEGTLQVGDLVAADAGLWSNLPTGYTYAWQRCEVASGTCTAIPGASSANYVVSSADAGSTLRVLVSASNDHGTSSAVASTVSAPVTTDGAFPVVLDLPQISGSPVSGQTLTATAGTWLDTPTDETYQWEDCDAAGDVCTAIAGAAQATYTLGPGDVGAAIEVRVAAVNAAGAATAVSAPTAVVSPAPPGLVPAPISQSPPIVAGTPAIGATLTATPGTWSGSGPISYSYLSLLCTTSCSSIPGANGPTVTVSYADAGGALEVVVAAANAGGAGLAVSAPTALVPSDGPSTLLPTAASTLSCGAARSGARALRIVLTSQANVSKVLARHAAMFMLTVPTGGRLIVAWYLTRGHAKHVLIGTGNVTFARAGRWALALHLRRRGERLLSDLHHGASLLALAELFPTHGQTQTAESQFRLRG